MSALVVDALPARRLPRIASGLIGGADLDRLPGMQVWTGLESIAFEADPPVWGQADGEITGAWNQRSHFPPTRCPPGPGAGTVRGLNPASRVPTAGRFRRWPTGITPSRPAWKSSYAWISSVRVFITNGPYQATGSPIGLPPRMSTSSSGLRLSWTGSAAMVIWSPLSENDQLTHFGRSALDSECSLATQDVDQRVEVGPPWQPELRPGAEGGVHHRDRRVGRSRALMATNLAGDDPEKGPAIGRTDQDHLAGAQVLITGRQKLVLGGEVDPQLEAMEQPAGHDERLRWLLDVKQDPNRRSSTGCRRW